MTMKTLIISLIVIISISGCTENTDCCSGEVRPSFPHIKIYDENSQDLLNPKTGIYKEEDISFWHFQDGKRFDKDPKVEVRFFFDSSNGLDTSAYVISVGNFIQFNEHILRAGYEEYFLKIGSDIDTISWVIIENKGGYKEEDLRLNGELWTENDTLDYTYIIRK